MKKIILIALVSIFTFSTFSAFAHSDLEDHQTDYSTQAFDVLNEKIDNNEITAYGRKGEVLDLRAALADAGEYLIHIFSGFTFFGDDEDEYIGNVKDLKFGCDENTAKCHIKVIYKSGDIKERLLTFKVHVTDNMPSGIVNNQILIVDKK